MQSSFPRKREPRDLKAFWMSACVGTTTIQSVLSLNVLSNLIPFAVSHELVEWSRELFTTPSTGHRLPMQHFVRHQLADFRVAHRQALAQDAFVVLAQIGRLQRQEFRALGEA